MKVRTGVKKDGAITAMHFQTLLDGGGYGSYGVASTYYTGALQTVTYKVPRVPIRRRARLHEQAAVRSQARARHAAAALRARGRSSTRSPCDLGLDPAEIRLRASPPRRTR